MDIKDIFTESVKKWFDDKGDIYHRINYPELNSDSVVFDVGGYLGTFTESIYTRYGSNIFLFEPVDEFYKACDFKFSHVPKIKTYRFGLSSKNVDCKIYLSGDASSISHIANAKPEIIQLRDILRVIEELNINTIDLIKINIEGEEYNLLEGLISNPDLLKRINNIQVQYHTFIPSARERREYINNILKNTHDCNWCYEWVWENWKLR